MTRLLTSPHSSAVMTVLRRCFVTVTTVAAVSMLASCAGQSAFRNATSLYEEAQYEPALEQYQLAIAADPRNSEFRLNYLKAREQVTNKWIRSAEQAQAANKNGEANALYHRVLAIDETNARAQDGLRTLDRDNRHAQFVAEAQSLTTTGDIDGALARLKVVLNENPNYAPAKEL
jgi:general secretion pathway protein D